MPAIIKQDEVQLIPLKNRRRFRPLLIALFGLTATVGLVLDQQYHGNFYYSVVVFAQLVLPVGLLLWMETMPPPNRLGLYLLALVSLIAMLALALAGLWLMLPWWMPWCYGLLFFVVLVVTIRRQRGMNF